MKVAILIPARGASTRLPGKMLLTETGKPLIQHTVEQARKVKGVAQVLVATDDVQIYQAMQHIGAEVVMTDAHHPTGTDRLAQAAANLTGIDTIVGLQGDEPEIDPTQIEALISMFATSKAMMGTLVAPFATEHKCGPGSPLDPNCVKVVLKETARENQALYFSRSLIPYPRSDAGVVHNPHQYYQHIGIYIYRREFLQQFVTWPQTPLEQTEQLEQLRALENGVSIVAHKVPHAWPGIDTLADYQAFVKRYLTQSAVEPLCN